MRLRRDGLLQIISRVDRQVKINGQRVEPAEVEDALRRVHGTTAAATAVRREGGGRGPAGLHSRGRPNGSVPTGASACGGEQIFADLHATGANSRHRQISSIPGGKVDEKALLAIADATPRERQQALHKPAATLRVRRAVARAWMRTLDRESLEGRYPSTKQEVNSLDLLKFVFFSNKKAAARFHSTPSMWRCDPANLPQRLDAHLGSAPVAENGGTLRRSS